MRVQTGGMYCSIFGYACRVPNYAVVEDHEDGECADGGYAPDGLCLHRSRETAERCLAHRQSGAAHCVSQMRR